MNKYPVGFAVSQAFGNKAPLAYIFRHPGKSLPGFPRLAAEYSMGLEVLAI